MSYDDYDGYENEDYQDIEDTSSGFQIVDSNEIIRDDREGWDEAEQFLLQGELQAKKDQDLGLATEADLQLGRIGHVEFSTQEAIRDALLGNLDASKAGLDEVNVLAAVERFSSITGTDPTVLASRIQGGKSSTAYSIDAVTGERTAIPPSYSKQDIRTAISMLGNTAGEYLERGPGSTLPSNYLDPEKKGEYELGLDKAYASISKIAELYIPEATKKSSIYGLRKRQVEESLTKRFMDGNLYEGHTNLLPLPNETGVAGIIPTMSYWKGFSSPFNTLSFESVRGDIPAGELYKYMPSVADSLFKRPKFSKKGLSQSEIERIDKKQKRDQEFQYDAIMEEAGVAMRTLREAFPTMANESYGSERYMTKTRHEDDWGERSYAMDEAAYFDLERTNIDTPEALRSVSEQERFLAGESVSSILGYTEEEEVKSYAQGAQGEYQRYLERDPQPKQGSPEWFKRREGLITGSKVSALKAGMGTERMAVSLAAERMGIKDPYSNLDKYGNAYTEMGKVGEDIALRSFLRGPGRGLSFEETYLETNASMAGFGATPDGRLYNSDGTSAGLLELKYLGDSTFEDALKAYTPQAQLQMAVGEEEQTHLYVLNRETGEPRHHLIKADKALQSELIESGKKALELSQGLNASGMEDLMSKIKLSNRKARSVTGDKAGSEARFVEANTTAEEPMSAFDPDANTVVAGRASNTLFAEKLKKADQAAKMKDAVDMANMSKVEAAETKKQAEDRKMALTEVAAYKEDANRAREAEVAALKDSEDTVRNFSSSVKKASGVLGELANVAMAGNRSGMDEVRLAAESGISVEKLRGTREALEMGGLSTSGINAVIGSAASQMRIFDDPALGADEYTRQVVAVRRSNLPELSNLDIPLPEAQSRMDVQERVAMVSGMMEGRSAEARSFIASTFGMGSLAVSDIDTQAISSAFDTYIDEGGLRSQRRGELEVTQKLRVAEEGLGSIGELTGNASTGVSAANAILGSASAAVLGAGAMKLVSSRGVNASKAIKSLSTVGKANPLTAAASLAPMAIRHITGIKEDGSIADTAMDVLESASLGAAIGSFAGPFGTLIGGAVGGTAGLVHEFFDDETLPASDIGAIPRPEQGSTEGKIVNNITVKNEISPELVRTETNINGDLNEDEEVLL